MQLYRLAYGRCSPVDAYFYQVYQKEGMISSGKFRIVHQSNLVVKL